MVRPFYCSACKRLVQRGINMAVSDEIRLLYEQTCENFRKTWDLYIKFYTVFLTTNIAGLGLVSKYITSPEARTPIVAAFVIQNLFVAGTSIGISHYSSSVSRKLTDMINLGKHSTPIPSNLAFWGGYANSIASITLIVIWIFARTLTNAAINTD